MQKCSALLDLRKIKTTVRYCPSMSEWLLSQRKKARNAGADVVKGNSYTLLAGLGISVTTVDNSMGFPKKLEIDMSYYPTIPPLGIYPKDMNISY